MFENIIVGPICAVYTPEDKIAHLKEINKNGYIPLLELNKGDLFETIKENMPKGDMKASSILISIAYLKLYE